MGENYHKSHPSRQADSNTIYWLDGCAMCGKISPPVFGKARLENRSYVA